MSRTFGTVVGSHRGNRIRTSSVQPIMSARLITLVGSSLLLCAACGDGGNEVSDAARPSTGSSMTADCGTAGRLCGLDRVGQRLSA